VSTRSETKGYKIIGPKAFQFFLLYSCVFRNVVLLKNCLTITRTTLLSSRDSAVGIATGYGLDDRDVRVRVPVESRIFSSPRRPDRLWGPPNLLSNGYQRLFPGGKSAGCEADHSPSASAEVKKYGSLHPLPHTPSWCSAGIAQSAYRRATGWTAGVRFPAGVRFFSVYIVHGYRGRFPREESGRGVKLTTRLHLVPRSRMEDVYFHSPIPSALLSSRTWRRGNVSEDFAFVIFRTEEDFPLLVAAGYSERLLPTYKTSWRHIPPSWTFNISQAFHEEVTGAWGVST
jgi:hypothetical protein